MGNGRNIMASLEPQVHRPIRSTEEALGFDSVLLYIGSPGSEVKGPRIGLEGCSWFQRLGFIYMCSMYLLRFAVMFVRF